MRHVCGKCKFSVSRTVYRSLMAAAAAMHTTRTALPLQTLKVVNVKLNHTNGWSELEHRRDQDVN